MFRSQIIRIIRGFIRNKQSTIINVLGLSIGLTSAMLIALYALDEYQYDQFHADAQNIYRFNTQYGPLNESVPVGPYLLNDHLIEKIPEIRSTLRVRTERDGDFWLRYSDRSYTHQNFLIADPNFFTFFSFPLILGDPGNVLDDPNSVVISESAALRIFGDKNPAGETIFVQGMYPVTITGIMKDFPRHSHFQASFVANSEIARNYASFLFENWGSFGFHYYFLLEDHADPAEISDKINLVTLEVAPELSEIVNFDLQHLLDIRLHSGKIAWDIDIQGNNTLLNGLLAVAAVILLLGSVNYINLYTAQAARRGKETGIRKVLGAGRFKIIMHSMIESAIYIVVSFVIAIGLTEILLPYVNILSDKLLSLGTFFIFPNWLFLTLLLVIITLLSGLYPAIIVGSFQPADIFRNSLPATKNFPGRIFSFKLRQILIVFQFCCATSLIILSLSVNSQIRYMINKDYGYEDSGLFVIHNPRGETQESRFYQLKNALESFSEISVVTAGVNVPTERLNNFTYIRMPDDDHELQTGVINVHPDYFAALGTRTLAGRVFEPGYKSDAASGIVINHTAARALGKSPEDIVDQEVVSQSVANNMQVIGVIDDIHFFSLHEMVTPMIFTTGHEPLPYDKILICAGENMLARGIDLTRQIWQEEYSEYPFNFSVIQENRINQYSRETQTRKLTGIFMSLAIIISLMGLYALASFILTARTKEIAVRKVHGADHFTILKMIISEFSLLVLISALLSWPLVWMVLNRWLDNFAYRQDINYWFFLAAPLVSLIAAWLTISWNTYKAASVNPAMALKRE